MKINKSMLIPGQRGAGNEGGEVLLLIPISRFQPKKVVRCRHVDLLEIQE